MKLTLVFKLGWHLAHTFSIIMTRFGMWCSTLNNNICFMLTVHFKSSSNSASMCVCVCTQHKWQFWALDYSTVWWNRYMYPSNMYIYSNTNKLYAMCLYLVWGCDTLKAMLIRELCCVDFICKMVVLRNVWNFAIVVIVYKRRWWW